MRRATFTAGAVGLAIAPATVASAAPAPPSKIFVALWRGETAVERGFRAYLEQADLAVEYVYADAGQDRTAWPGIVARIRKERPDLVYAFSTEGALGVAGTLRDHEGKILDIPVVFTNVGDPVAARLVETLEPGRRRPITGVIHLAPMSTQLAAMTQFLPIRRLGMLYNSAETYGRAAVREMHRLAREKGIDVHVETVATNDKTPSVANIDGALRRIAARRPDMLFIPSTSFFIPLAKPITEAANALRLPTFDGNGALVKTGSAMAAIAGSQEEVGSFAGLKAAQILRGHVRANDVPIESLRRFGFYVNANVCRQLDVYPTLEVLKYATIVPAGR